MEARWSTTFVMRHISKGNRVLMEYFWFNWIAQCVDGAEMRFCWPPSSPDGIQLHTWLLPNPPVGLHVFIFLKPNILNLTFVLVWMSFVLVKTDWLRLGTEWTLSVCFWFSLTLFTTCETAMSCHIPRLSALISVRRIRLYSVTIRATTPPDVAHIQ